MLTTLEGSGGVGGAHLVEVLAGEKGLVAGQILEQSREGVRLLTLLPSPAAAVALQRVVGDVVVVRVFARQDAGAAGAAQRTGYKLAMQRKAVGEYTWKPCCRFVRCDELLLRF